MPTFEQKTLENGNAIVKLIRIIEPTNNNIRSHARILIPVKHYKENSDEMMVIRTTPLTGLNNKSHFTISAEKLSINKLTATINHLEKTITLGPAGGLNLEDHLRGKGIGTYMMNLLVVWLKRNFSDYTILSCECSIQENAAGNNKDRFMNFITNFGLIFKPQDNLMREGIIESIKVYSLKEHKNTDKVEEVDVERFIFETVRDKTIIESKYNELKEEFDSRGKELLAGVPKTDIIKYTVIGCAAVIIIFVLIFL